MTANDKKKTGIGTAGNEGGLAIPWRMVVWGAAGLFLLAMVVGNQVSTEVNWTVSDFVFAGALLFGTLAIYEIAVKMTRDPLYRAGVGVALAGALLLAWINAAVGITDGFADVAYLGVPVVGFVGALLARFRSAGMARALIATAVAQAFVTAIALGAGMVPAHNSVSEILGINGIFVMLFVGSAVLFRTAARRDLERGTA